MLVAMIAAVGCGGTTTSTEQVDTELDIGLDPGLGETSAELRGMGPELAAVRAATAKYHNVEAALADGFVPVSECTSSPMGAMGVHYLRPDRLDLTTRPTEPELLLYEPRPGGMRLVAVEYMVPVIVDGRPYFGTTPPPAMPSPTVLGHTMHGPMAGHGPGMPWHWDFHVWLWRHNPSGMFEDWNPAVTCPPG